MALETVYAIHSFSAEKGDEISFEYGEPILVFEKDEMYGDGWWQGKNVRGEIGLFPMNYTSYSKPLPPSPKVHRHNKSTNNNNKSNNISRNYNSNLNRNSKRDSINFSNYRIPLANQYYYHSIDGMIDDIQSKSDETSLNNNNLIEKVSETGGEIKGEKDEQLLSFQSRNNNRSNDESQFLSYNSDNNYNNNYNYNNNNKKLSQNTSSSSASSFSSHLSSSTKGTSSIYSQNQLQSFQQQQIDDNNNNNNKINVLALATTKTTTITTYNNEKLKGHPTMWNVEKVCSWLHEKGFDSVTQKNFRDNDITGDILLDLNTDVLKELNIASFGKRVHIMKAITALKSEFSINDKNKENEKDDSSEYEEQTFVDQKPSSHKLGNRKYSISNPSLSKYPDNNDTNITHGGFQNGSKRSSTAVKFSNDTKKVSYSHQATLQKSESNFSNKENNDEKNNKLQRSIFSKMSQLTKSNNNKKAQKSLSMFSPQKKTDKPRTISTGGWEFKDDKEYLDSSDDNNNNKNKSNSNNSKLSRSRLISSDINNNNGNNNEKKSFKYLPNFNNNNKPKKSAMDKNALFGGVSISQPNSPRHDKFNSNDYNDYYNEYDNYNYILEYSNNGKYDNNSDSEIDEDVLDSIGVPDHEGWLKKQGNKYKVWKSRLCILKDANLYYLKTDKDLNSVIVKGHINLTNYRVIPDENLLYGKYGFKLVHDTNRTHYFAHDDQQSIKEWMKAIMKATISRDVKVPVISSNNIITMPLDEAIKMAPRPPPLPPSSPSHFSTFPTQRQPRTNIPLASKASSPTLRPESPPLSIRSISPPPSLLPRSSLTSTSSHSPTPPKSKQNNDDDDDDDDDSNNNNNNDNNDDNNNDNNNDKESYLSSLEPANNKSSQHLNYNYDYSNMAPPYNYKSTMEYF